MSTLYVFLLILALVSVASFLIQRGSYSPRSATGDGLLFSSLGGGGIAVLVSCLGFYVLAPLPIILVIIAVACSCFDIRKRTGRRILAASTALIDLVYLGLCAMIVWQLNTIKQEHPVVSLVDRLDYEHEFRIADVKWNGGGFAYASHPPESFPATEGIPHDGSTPFEEELANESAVSVSRTGRYRSLRSLLHVHESIELQFAMTIGFGVYRTIDLPYRKWNLDLPDHSLLSLPKHQGAVAVATESDGESAIGVDYSPWHRQNLMSFLHPKTFGMVGWHSQAPDLSRVVGFQPHAFGSLPDPPSVSDSVSPWQIDALSLVSLLKHRPGAVYLSDSLPNMTELTHVPTRPMDDFEANAVTRLSRGEELIVTGNSTHLRMVGSIRAAYQCLDCHQVKRGTLLGAFSYRLSRVQPIESHSSNVE